MPGNTSNVMVGNDVSWKNRVKLAPKTPKENRGRGAVVAEGVDGIVRTPEGLGRGKVMHGLIDGIKRTEKFCRP